MKIKLVCRQIPVFLFIAFPTLSFSGPFIITENDTLTFSFRNAKEGYYKTRSVTKADLFIEFNNIAGSSDLQLNTGIYANASGQHFNVTKLKYYASNFKLTKVDGSEFTVPQNECYFLIDESIPATQTPVLQVPEGEYKTLSFVLGVDSLRNAMDISQRTGDLDISGVAADMYWSWNSGYIFFKMEGTSPSLPPFNYHIGGFGGYKSATTNNLKTITLDLTKNGIARVKKGKDTKINLLADILKVLNGTTNIIIGSPAEIQSPKAGKQVADNYAYMISHGSTEN